MTAAEHFRAALARVEANPARDLVVANAVAQLQLAEQEPDADRRAAWQLAELIQAFRRLTPEEDLLRRLVTRLGEEGLPAMILQSVLEPFLPVEEGAP